MVWIAKVIDKWFKWLKVIDKWLKTLAKSNGWMVEKVETAKINGYIIKIVLWFK